MRRIGFLPLLDFHFFEQNNRFLVGAGLLICKSKVGLCRRIIWLQRDGLLQFLDCCGKFSEADQHRAQGTVSFLNLRHQANNCIELHFGGLEVIVRHRCSSCAISCLDLIVDVPR